jgi:hypothetical protein
VLLTEHFKNAVICSNVLYCIGASAMASFEKKLIPPPKEREDGIHGTAGIDVNTIDFVPLDASKPINPIRLRQLVIEQKESITALVEKVFHRENTDLSDVWFATVVTIIACIRAHQADTLVMSNGIFALGRLAQAAAGLKSLASALRGVETVVQSMHLHDHDSIMASNGCLAIARICHCPNIDYHEDRNVAFDTIDKNSAIQEKAIQEGALQAVYDAERNHGEDPIVARSFAEAVGGLAIGSSHLGMEDVQEVAGRICKAMSHDFHEIEASRDHYPTIFDEVHGRDEFVTAYGAKALGSMVLVKSTHKAAGQDKRFPYLISDPDKQDAIAKVGAIQCMCMALKQFPKKKDTVLSLCGPALAHAIRLHENNQVTFICRAFWCVYAFVSLLRPAFTNVLTDGQPLASAPFLFVGYCSLCAFLLPQRLFVRHKGVDFIMAIMNKWEEDHDFYFLMLRTLRVLLEGTDGIRNYWFLDTNKGRDVGKFVVKVRCVFITMLACMSGA